MYIYGNECLCPGTRKDILEGDRGSSSQRGKEARVRGTSVLVRSQREVLGSELEWGWWLVSRK